MRRLVPFALVLLAAWPADARPRGTYVRPPAERITVTAHDGSHLLYLNRCSGGETYTPGNEDSRQNTSSILLESYDLPEYVYGDASWNEVVAITQALFARYEITVTDEDPGDTPHHEAVVCGVGTDLGEDSDVAGIAPFDCAVIENSVSFTFPEAWGNVPQLIAETIGQEAAHAWGLDHEVLCEDIMTWLEDCSDPRTFIDQAVPCGELTPRACDCGGTTQNSHQRLLAVFGDPDDPPVFADAGPGALGDPCANNGDCANGLCADDGTGEPICSDRCDMAADDCGAGFECASLGGGDDVCLPTSSGGCGCAIGERPRSGVEAVMFLAALAVLRRRRRR